MAAKCAALGITFNFGQSNVLPDATHTHYVVPKLQKEGTVPQLVAAGYQLTMVATTWADALFAAAELAEGTTKSPLQQDFGKHWPKELDYFPPIEGKDSNQLERGIWQAKAARRKLFEGCLFVDFSSVSHRSCCFPCSG